MRKKKTWLGKLWQRLLRRCQDGQCQVGIPETSSKKISWRERR